MLLLLLVLQADLELEQAVAKERERIAAKKPLTDAERAAFTKPEGAASKAVTAYRLAVLPADFADVKGTRALKDDLASVAEFYAAMSSKAFTLTSAIQERAALEAKREEAAAWPTGGDAEAKLVRAAVGGLRNRVGEDTFKEIDGVLIAVAGGIGARGTALWPHQSEIDLGDRRVGYLIVPEDLGVRWRAIAAHEFGHLLGLDDKYEDKAAKVGKWCLMGTGYLGDDRDPEKKPLPLCAVCRARLGWLGVATLDPRKDHAVALADGGAVRVKLNTDDKEALVLEMRGGRIIAWHTGGGKAIELTALLPSKESDRLTPWSDPALQGRTAGWLTVWVTDLRVEGGVGYARIGSSGSATPLEELRRARVGKTIK